MAIRILWQFENNRLSGVEVWNDIVYKEHTLSKEFEAKVQKCLLLYVYIFVLMTICGLFMITLSMENVCYAIHFLKQHLHSNIYQLFLCFFKISLFLSMIITMLDVITFFTYVMYVLKQVDYLKQFCTSFVKSNTKWNSNNRNEQKIINRHIKHFVENHITIIG